MTTGSDQRSAINQALLASIVESSDDAIISKDLNGNITTWNRAATRTFGHAAQEVIGSPITILIPLELRHQEDMILARIRRGERLDHYETVRRRKDGSLVDVSLTISPLLAADGAIIGASKIAREITYRKRREAQFPEQTERLEDLHRLATMICRDLDLETIVQRVTDISTALTGAKFGAFFYNVTHRDSEALLLFTLSGAPREAFEKLGLPRATAIFAPTFHGTRNVRSDDIRGDPRYGHNPPYNGMPPGHLPVVSYLAVPVLSRTGEVIGGLFFGHDLPGVFTQAAEDIATTIAAHAAVAIDNARLYASAQQEMQSKELLLKEFEHRMKNTLATVQAIASQTLRKCDKEERDTFIARLHALADGHASLAEGGWNQASVQDAVTRTLRPFGTERIRCDGPPEPLLDGLAALRLAMALHELATNAVKYGALSNTVGHVQVRWRRDGENVVLTWQEAGGPPVRTPGRTGFGSLLIEQATSGHAQLDYQPEGFRCSLTMPILPLA